MRSAALGFFVGAGSRGERTEEAGLSHFLEHMLFRGTERYGSAEIDQLFDGMGAELNAGTDKEGTTVYARMLDQHLPRAFDVIADMVWRPAFNDVDPEREVVLEEIAMYEDDPQDTVFDVLGDAVFGDHPLGRPIIGRAPVIRDTPVADIADFHARRYVPSSVVVAAAGSVDHDVVVELAERTLAGLRAGCAGPGARRGAGAPARPRALPGQGDRAGPRLPRRHRAAAPRRPPPRAARPRRDLRRAELVAAVPERARGARPGLRGLLVLRPVHRLGPDRPLRRHAAGQGGGGDGRRPRRARADARAARDRGGARPRPRERQGAHRARARVVRRADEPARRRDALRPAAARHRRRDGEDRRGDARRPPRPGRRAVGARSASPPPASGRRARRSARPWRRCARPQSPSRHDPRRRRRRRGADGGGGLRGRGGRR